MIIALFLEQALTLRRILPASPPHIRSLAGRVIRDMRAGTIGTHLFHMSHLVTPSRSALHPPPNYHIVQAPVN
jgi:hypothetical protein